MPTARSPAPPLQKPRRCRRCAVCRMRAGSALVAAPGWIVRSRLDLLRVRTSACGQRCAQQSLKVVRQLSVQPHRWLAGCMSGEVKRRSLHDPTCEEVQAGAPALILRCPGPQPAGAHLRQPRMRALMMQPRAPLHRRPQTPPGRRQRSGPHRGVQGWRAAALRHAAACRCDAGGPLSG